jgi:hypothetical protein
MRRGLIIDNVRLLVIRLVRLQNSSLSPLGTARAARQLHPMWSQTCGNIRRLSPLLIVSDDLFLRQSPIRVIQALSLVGAHARYALRSSLILRRFADLNWHWHCDSKDSNKMRTLHSPPLPGNVRKPPRQVKVRGKAQEYAYRSDSHEGSVNSKSSSHRIKTLFSSQDARFSLQSESLDSKDIEDADVFGDLPKCSSPTQDIEAEVVSSLITVHCFVPHTNNEMATLSFRHLYPLQKTTKRRGLER